MEKYLIGIEYDPFNGIAGIAVVEHHLKGWRYFSTYETGKAQKKVIFEKLASQE